jgi:hypothetical protein
MGIEREKDRTPPGGSAVAERTTDDWPALEARTGNALRAVEIENSDGSRSVHPAEVLRAAGVPEDRIFEAFVSPQAGTLQAIHPAELARAAGIPEDKVFELFFSSRPSRDVVPARTDVPPARRMDTSLPWNPETGDVILRREPTGLRNSDGTPSTRIVTNVAWTHFAGSSGGFEWGYTGSGPTELAINILNQFVPPRADGHEAVQGDAVYWAGGRQTECSRTAACLAHDFRQTFLSNLPPEGAVISGAEIQAWIEARADRVRRGF